MHKAGRDRSHKVCSCTCREELIYEVSIQLIRVCGFNKDQIWKVQGYECFCKVGEDKTIFIFTHWPWIYQASPDVASSSGPQMPPHTACRRCGSSSRRYFAYRSWISPTSNGRQIHPQQRSGDTQEKSGLFLGE